MSYSPNLPIGSAWKSTLTLAFQTLRRIKFIIESDFAFGDFNPNTNFGGMTVTNYEASYARYLRINKFLFISVRLSATLAAPFNNGISISLPENIRFASAASQRGATSIANAGFIEVGLWEATRNTNTITIYRNPVGTNYTAGVSNLNLTTFLEIQ